MRFSIACTIAVLLQTAFAAPLTAGNGPSVGTVEDSTNAVPHCQSGADYDHQGIAKRGKGTGRGCSRTIKGWIASAKCTCIDVGKGVNKGINNINAAAAKTNAELVRQVRNGGTELNAFEQKVTAKVKSVHP
ncbi:hypothetical protein MCOR11_011168 [Pyricularia oryzae]|nr:hypothetical protein MCOR24_002659 [Pyricularia oryzae]KAI6443059.1 hypothetical protein MCOR15_011287 [Pyricularia oryzae]KAI6481971.1 hypothetical protein MCOR11_011168 [Pyricularia oryzae]KAI6532078.1 hypothetical protein MCOR16_004016 [Pyricularia oryzae]